MAAHKGSLEDGCRARLRGARRVFARSLRWRAELRRQVETLLAFLSVDHGTESLVGRRIGPYRLMREGHGGMGTVYLAERTDRQYRRRVAIKLLNLGLGTEGIVRRFRNERQVLLVWIIRISRSSWMEEQPRIAFHIW